MNRIEQRAALRQEWLELVTQYEITGQSVRGWCQEQDIPEHKMRYWLRKFREPTTPPGPSESRFIAIASQQHLNATSGVTVRVGSVSIEVQRGFDPQVLIDVVQSLTGYDQ